MWACVVVEGAVLGTERILILEGQKAQHPDAHKPPGTLGRHLVCLNGGWRWVGVSVGSAPWHTGLEPAL